KQRAHHILLFMTPNLFRSKTLAACLAVAAAVGIWFTTRAQAQTAKFEYRASGMFGLASGQTARLSVVTVGIGVDLPVELIFLDSDGAVLARSVQTAVPGNAIVQDLHYPAGRTVSLPVRTLVRWPTRTNREGYVLHPIRVMDDVTGRDAVLYVDYAG